MRHSPSASISENVLPTEELQGKKMSQVQAICPFEGRLRGLRWRAMLGVLPPCPAPVEELRRVAANGRRRYAEVRRRLLVDPHIMEEVQKPHHLSMDNPLSQDPESVWGRYFQNAELERIIDKDLTRLYPEHGNFFQTPGCQAMLRRILLVWSLIHPHYSYRQGMHELLAPLVYVLQSDVIHLLEVKKRYEDLFDDRFDGPLFQETDVHGNEMQQKGTSFLAQKTPLVAERSIMTGDEWVERIDPQDIALVSRDEFGFSLRTMVLGSDSYGAEGELGALLSGRFVEHDAYCMFDALLSGEGGEVPMADYFMTVSSACSATGLSPALEASAALYQALAAADTSLYSHLVGLGVEPQFFALRWLRVLFGREFDLENLLLLWDAIFSAQNTDVPFEQIEDRINSFQCSPRSAFISALAVSMLVYLRPTLLAAPNATSCLQKLLNFPQTADVRSLIKNAKMLQPLAEEAARLEPAEISKFGRNFEHNRIGKLIRNGSGSPPIQGHSTTPKNKRLQHRNSCSPEVLRYSVPDSYWEEKWKNSVLQKIVPPQNMEKVPLFDNKSSSLSQQDVASSPVRNLLEEIVDMENLSTIVKETQDVSYAGSFEYLADNGTKSVRRKLAGGQVEGVVLQSSSKNKNKETFASPSSPHRFGISGHLSRQDAVEVRKRADNNNVYSPSLDIKVSPDRVLRGGIFDSTENEQALPRIESDLQPSTHRVITEELCGNLGNVSLLHRAKTSAAGSRAGKSFWMWNLGKSNSSDKINGIVQPSKDQQLSNGAAMLATPFLDDLMTLNQGGQASNEPFTGVAATTSLSTRSICMSTANGMESEVVGGEDNQAELSNKGDLFKRTSSDSSVSCILKEEDPSAIVQSLGLSMLDNIQVLETALSEKAPTLGKESLHWAPVVPKEKLDGFAKTVSNGKGHVTALTALAELRKIGNILLQM